MGFNYVREYTLKRNKDRVIDLGAAGSFKEVVPLISGNPNTMNIHGAHFTAIHTILASHAKRVFTAFRSREEPGILVIVWDGFPFYPHIEEGGDFMLQTMYDDSRVRHLIIDNTCVRSNWLSEKMKRYLSDAWHPGLIQLGLKSFCHLQALSFLGGHSFQEFAKLVSESITDIAKNLGMPPFRYYPIETADASTGGTIEQKIRISAFEKAMRIIRETGQPDLASGPAD